MKKLISQAVRFIGLSGIGWILDMCVYTVLSKLTGNLVMSNIISSWAGVTFVFLFATRKIFEVNTRISLKLKYLIYIGYQCILIYLISKLLNGINSWIVMNISAAIIIRFSALISKIIVTPITMSLNFMVMKCVIEK